MSTATVLRLGDDQPRYEVVTITPADAEKILADCNTHNRNLRPQTVSGYARDMTAGCWKENGEAIKFAKDGTLLDGQHRLAAIAQSGTSQRMLVVTGLELATQETMDDGRKRTLADALTLRGERNTVTLAAVSRRALMWTQGSTRNGGGAAPTNAECLAFLAEHPELHESGRVAVVVRAGSHLAGSVAGLAHWVFSCIDESDATWFFERLADGANMPKYHPVMTLRKRLEENAVSATRLPEDTVLAFVIKAWNAYRDGEELKLLRFKPGGAMPEKFPMPH